MTFLQLLEEKQKTKLVQIGNSDIHSLSLEIHLTISKYSSTWPGFSSTRSTNARPLSCEESIKRLVHRKPLETLCISVSFSYNRSVRTHSLDRLWVWNKSRKHVDFHNHHVRDILRSIVSALQTRKGRRYTLLIYSQLGYNKLSDNHQNVNMYWLIFFFQDLVEVSR